MDRNLISDAAYLLHAVTGYRHSKWDTLKTSNSSADILSLRDSVVFVLWLLTEALICHHNMMAVLVFPFLWILFRNV